MERPRIRHVALNVQDRNKEAEYYKRVFGMEYKSRGPNGTIYLSDGHVGVALISRSELPWGINHFGFQLESSNEIEENAETTAVANSAAAVGESMIYDSEGYRGDISVEGWPI
ncbi:MAG: VOC family protein [Dehalococcoidia bacterium]|nr:VOC family protein [Dehalococcoidia bacterium]